MDFTREPIIETVITPKEGCKLVVRSSKTTGQEEYFVDAVEIVSFGHSFFFRSLERPKAFLAPVTDYEIIEVREARMVLKNVGVDRSIKIGGGRDAQIRNAREVPSDKLEGTVNAEETTTSVSAQTPIPAETKPNEKKRDRRRHYRRRRGREENLGVEEDQESEKKEAPGKIELPEPKVFPEAEDSLLTQPITTASILTSLLPPPPTLISETIARYKDNALFRGAFYSKEDKIPEEKSLVSSEQPELKEFEISENDQENTYPEPKQDDALGSVYSDNVAEEYRETPMIPKPSEEKPSHFPLQSEQSREEEEANGYRISQEDEPNHRF